MRTTKKTLQYFVELIAEKANLATNKEQAIKMGLDKYLYLEYNSVYGGYRLVNVGINNGAHYGAFGGNGCEANLKASNMLIKLRAINEGIVFGVNELTKNVINELEKKK